MTTASDSNPPGTSDQTGTGDSTADAFRRSNNRKPFSKGVERAMILIASLADNIHRNEVAGTKLEGLSSIEVLQELIELQRFIHGEETDGELTALNRLAEVHSALGQHEDALEAVESLLEKQSVRSVRNLQVAALLRLKANCLDNLDRPAEGAVVRQEAYAIIAELLGKPDAVTLLSRLVVDGVGASGNTSERPTRDWDGFAAPDAHTGPGQAVPKRGDIWWVEFPQYPNDPHQPRPAVVVSVDHRNQRADKVQVVPLSTTNNGHRMNFAIPKASSGLPNDSCAKCGDLTAVAKSMLRGEGPVGFIDKPAVDGILQLAQQALFH